MIKSCCNGTELEGGALQTQADMIDIARKHKLAVQLI